MKKTILVIILALLASHSTIAQQVTTAAARSTGWKKLASLTGRGYGTVTISSTGGDHRPVMTTVKWYHDWEDIAGLSIQSESNASPYWREFRITGDANGIYIEANFVNTVLGLRLVSDDYGWNPAVLYSGTLPAGGGSVRAESRAGRLSIEDYFQINFNGNVGIGTATPTEKLDVNGTVRAREIKLEATGWPDYVFEKDYRLMPLEEVRAYIDQNGHLPGLKSAAEYEAEGVGMMTLNQKLLEKIEELVIYVITQEDAIKDLGKRVNELDAAFLHNTNPR